MSQRPTHGHKQIRSRLSAFACHSIGGCSFCLIDIPGWMDDDLFGQGGQVDPSGPLRSNGKVRSTTFVTASGVCTSGSWHDSIAASAIFVTDGIWHRQIEPMPTCRTAPHHGISCDTRWPCQSPWLQPDAVQGMRNSTMYIHIST
jgi:hypothetical protein